MAHTFSTGNEQEVRTWNVERLWEAAANLPVRTVPLEELLHHLDDTCWAYSEPRPGVWNDIHHAKRIFETDLAYPIILSADGELMDGAHRLAKAWIFGYKQIQVVQFEIDPEPDERRPGSAEPQLPSL